MDIREKRLTDSKFNLGAPASRKRKKEITNIRKLRYLKSEEILKVKRLEHEGVDLETIKQVDYSEVPGKDIVGGSFTRVVIIGDYFALRYSNSWPSSSRIKPYFIYKDKLRVYEIFLKFEDHPYLKGSSSILIIFMFSPHPFVTYEKYKLRTCVGEHPAIEFVREADMQKFQQKHLEIVIKAMSEAKEKFESNGCLSVLFSYFPEFMFSKCLQETFKYSRKNIQKCSCLCFPIGEKNVSTFTARFMRGIPFVNSYICNAGLNAINTNVFEFSPLEITFENGHFKTRYNTPFGQTDILVLESLVIKFVFYNDPPFMSLRPTNIQESINSCMVTMRTCVLGRTSNKSDKFRIFIVGDEWLNFIMNRWEILSKARTFFRCKNFLTFENIYEIITSFFQENEAGMIVTLVPSGELFTQNYSSCKNHEPLEFPVPKEDLLKDTVSFGQKLINKMEYFCNAVENSRKRCRVLFMTGYPTRFASYYERLSENHLKNFNKEDDHINKNDLINKNPAYYDTMVAQCIADVNRYIYSRNASYDIETCDVFDLLQTQPELMLTKEVIFPLHAFPRESIGLSPIAKNLFVYIQSYVQNLFIIAKNLKFDLSRANELKKKMVKTKIMEKQTEQNYCSPVSLAEEANNFYTVNKTCSDSLLIDAENRNKKGSSSNIGNVQYGVDVMTTAAGSTSCKRVDQGNFRHPSNMKEKANCRYMEYEQEYSYEQVYSFERGDSPEYQSKETSYQGVKNYRGLHRDQLHEKDFSDQIDSNTDNSLYDLDEPPKDRYESYPGIDSSGYNYSNRTLHKTLNSWSRNQQKLFAHQDSFRDLQRKFNQNVTKNVQPNNFTQQDPNIRNQQTKFPKQLDIRNTQKDSPAYQIPSLNVPTNISIQHECTSNATTNFQTAQNLARDSRNFIQNNQNLTRDTQNLTRETKNLSTGRQNLTRDTENLTRDMQPKVIYKNSGKSINIESDVSSSYSFPSTSHTNFPVQQKYGKNSSTNIYSHNTETKLSSQNLYDRNPPSNFYFQQGITEDLLIHSKANSTMQPDLHNQYSSPRYSQTAYPESQNSSSSLYTTYLVEPSYIGSPQAAYIVGQRIPRSQEVTYVPSQTFSRSYQGTYQNDSTASTSTQSNQSFYTMWQ